MAYTKRFDDALQFASELHRNQTRKGTKIPYVTHLMGVASIVGENYGTEDEVIAALLHDAIEDTAQTRESLYARFGPTVAEIVEGCSDAQDPNNKAAWEERKRAHIEHVANSSKSVQLVSAADKLHNARAILADYRTKGDDLWDRFKGGKEGTLRYYGEMVEMLRSAGANSIVEELDRVVSEIETLAGTQRRSLTKRSS